MVHSRSEPNQKPPIGAFAGYGDGATKGRSDDLVTRHVSGARGLPVPDCWVKDSWDREIRPTRERRRSNIEPPVACPFYNFGEPSGTISDS